MKNGNKGFSLAELMLALAIFGIIIPTVTYMFITLTRSFTSYEASSQLKSLNQKNLSRMYMKLTGNRRIFQDNTQDNLYLGRISLAGCPASLTGSRMPRIENDGSITPQTTSFIPTSVGNSLLFANNDSTQKLLSILDSSSTAHDVSIDAYRFYYYYLTPDNPKGIYSRQSYRLMEYSSAEYADYSQLIAINNSTLRSNTIKALYNNGISLAWNIAVTSVNNAFYSLDSSGNMIAVSGHVIVRDKITAMTKLITGIMGSGYGYGVSPNSSGWAAAPATVPKYATASANFPGGFEVTIVGSSSGRKVLIRQALVAQAGTKILADDRTILCSSRDLW